MAVNQYSTFSSNAQTYIAAQTLKRVHKDVIVYNLGKKEKLPNRFSKTFQFTRYERLDLPYAPLTEGTTPSDGDSMSISTVQATMDQWGSFVTLTDVAAITAKHPALQQAMELIAMQAKETIDRECIELLMSNTSVRYAGSSNTARADLAATDYITTSDVKRGLAALRNAGAHPVSGRLYVGLIDPSVEMDLLEDTTFQNAASYSNIMALKNGEAGIWMGVRWIVSNLLPTMGFVANITSAASNHASGALAASTTYYFKVTQVSNTTGFEVAVSAEETQATGMGEDSIQLTMPATAGYKYNVYVGSASGALKLHSTLNDPSEVVDVLAIPSSGNAPPASPVTGVTVHYVWLMGQEAFAVPELMSLQTFLTPATASDSDPLVQRRKLGWKVMFKPVICNESYIERIECASRY
jgi:N4-gp56 family major capsid protein